MTNIPSLYHVEENYLNLLSELENMEGELTPELEEVFKINEEKFKEKAEIYCKLIRETEGKIVFAKKEVERINDFISKKNKQIDILENNLLEAIKLFGDKDTKKDIWRYEVGTFKLSTRKSTSVELSEAMIDDKWKERTIADNFTIEEYTKISDYLGRNLGFKEVIKKTPIKEAIEAGELVEGASIVTKYSLTLK